MDMYLAWISKDYDKKMENKVVSHNEAAVRGLQHNSDVAGKVWEGWAHSKSGKIINLGLASGRLKIPGRYIGEAASILDQYVSALDAYTCVGIGTTLQEADVAAKAATKKGHQAIVLYTPELEGSPNKVADLDKGTADKKEKLGQFQEANAGFEGKTHPKEQQEPEEPQPQEPPQEPTEGGAQQGESEAEAEAPEQEAAQEEPSKEDLPEVKPQVKEIGNVSESEAEGAAAAPEDVESAVMESLRAIKAQLPYINKMKETNPEAYQAIMGLVSAVISMGQKVLHNDSPDLDKAQQKVYTPKATKPKQRAADNTSGKIRVVSPGGAVTWIRSKTGQLEQPKVKGFFDQ